MTRLSNLSKYILSESFVIDTFIDSASKVKFNTVGQHILSYYKEQNRYADNQYWYMNEYYKIGWHKHIQWIQEWATDHYRLQHNRNIVPANKDPIRGIILEYGDSINTHHNVKDWHLADSPDVDVLLPLFINEDEPSSLIFEYDDGRHRHKRIDYKLAKNRIYMFSSHLNRYITPNIHKEFTVCLSLHFQYMDMQ